MCRFARQRSVFIALGILAAILGAHSNLHAQEKTVDFAREIRPILAKHCYACHGPDKKEGGVRLTDFESATANGESGEATITPGKPDASELLKRIRSQEDSERMPPEGKPLTDREIDLIQTWIQEGAEFKQHWAFMPLERPTVPSPKTSAWARNPIDSFILHRLEKARLQPTQPAQARELIRRAYFNAIGVPPSEEVIDAFVANPSDQAYEQMVDELLASPQFGAKWARHWLDIVRFAETNSFERDGPKPNAWKYRDYVIRSFNADKPYSDFVREQLAGDELDQTTPESLTATGYYRLGIWDDEPADPLQARFDEYDDIVSTTGQAILGLTINCARCHDHKVDPISQKDYYQLVAFVRDVTSYGDRGNEKRNNQIDMTPNSLDDRYTQLNQLIERTEKDMRELEQKGIVKMSAEDQRATEGPERGKVIREKLKDYLDESDWKQWTSHRDQVKKAREEMTKLPPRVAVLGLARCEARPPKTHVLARGNPQAEGDVVEPDFPKLFESPKPTIAEASDQAKSAGRRKILADWMVSKENRLTARVIVNRLWQHHFGRGIQKSANNFGQMSEPPTHPELLDWLATELIRNDWNLKPIHRMIMLSSTYRMSSHAHDTSSENAELAFRKDPSNDLFWRFNMRRLSAEEIRDHVLAATGNLNLELFGPSIYPKLADEVKASQSVPGKGWSNSSESDLNKRSVYIHIKRSLIPPELANFDFPETDSSCEGRFLTTQPAQALGMLNGNFMQEQSKTWASYLLKTVPGSLEDRWAFAIRKAWGRAANASDIAALKQLHQQLKTAHGLRDEEALPFECLVILNANEFLYLD
ncbi:MAG: PSD1 and planctomycete cytochrome C domain-containing protein [Pirellulales bacterium]